MARVSVVASIPDFLRLLAVPVFGWAAVRDVRTRRVPNETWPPLLALALVALAWEGWLVWTGGTPTPVVPQAFLLRVLISVGFVVPLSYGFWWMGGFGGADAKALITLALLFPTFPTYLLPTVALPLVVPTLGVFSLSVLSNTVLAGIAYPFALTARNGLAGHVSRVMCFGRPIRWDEATREYGRLLETPGGFTRRGLDLDALRMYLAWRGTTLPDLRADPERYRDPASLPATPRPPGDGSIAVTDGGEPAGVDPGVDAEAVAQTDEAADAPGDGAATAADEADADASADEADADASADGEDVDPWGAAAFLEDVEGSAYGTSAAQLRDGLDVLTSADEVWITPGVPFLLPMFAGLLAALTYGDVLFALLTSVGPL
ncbi:MAG: prepilin peptidase [Haloarculaceae archaeon]